jgi:hypothetical protein
MSTEKIIISTSGKPPHKSVHSAFFQTYIQSPDILQVAQNVIGHDHSAPPHDDEDQWRLLFCYGAGYQGGGIYQWFGGFLIDSPSHGYDFIMTNDFSVSKEGYLSLQDATVAVGIGRSELEVIEGRDVQCKLENPALHQIIEVVSQWHETFDLSENEQGDEAIILLTTNSRLSKDYHHIGGNCYVSGEQTEWEDNIGIFSEHWGFLAKFRTD